MGSHGREDETGGACRKLRREVGEVPVLVLPELGWAVDGVYDCRAQWLCCQQVAGFG